MQLQPLDLLEIVDELHRGMGAGRGNPRRALDGPERIGLGHRTRRLQRLGHDPVHEAVGEGQARDPVHQRSRRPVAGADGQKPVAQDTAVLGHELHRHDGRRARARREARGEQMEEFRGEAHLLREVRVEIGRARLVARIARVRDHELDLGAEDRCQRVPVGRGREGALHGRDAGLGLGGDAVRQAADHDRETFGRGQRPQTGRTGRIARALHHGHGARLGCLREEQVGMGLQEARGAELENGGADVRHG